MKAMSKTWKMDWSKANWRLQDILLSARFGCSREAVRQARIKHADGVVADRYKQRTMPTARSRLEAMDSSGKTLSELAALVGCGKSQVGVVLRSLGKDFKRLPRPTKLDWTKFPSNWASMTDKEIAAVVGTGSSSTVADWRHEHGYDKKAARNKHRGGKVRNLTAKRAAVDGRSRHPASRKRRLP